jgi:hypothetical protein
MAFDYYGHDVDLVAMWVPSLYCKTGCYYCYNTPEQRSYLGPVFDKPILDKCINFFNNLGTVSILITGGEPFDFPNIMYLLNRLSKKHYLVIQTSLRKDIKEFMKNVPPTRTVFMRCSLHPFAQENFAPYFEKIKILKKKGYHPIVCVPGLPSAFANFPLWYNRFKRIDVATEITFGSLNGGIYPYNEKEMKFLENWMLNPVVRRQLHMNLSFAGGMCYTGWRDIYIPSDGIIHRCANDLVGIGNIFTGELNLASGETPCSCGLCGCRNYLYDEVVLKDGSRRHMQALIDGFVPCLGDDKMRWSDSV